MNEIKVEMGRTKDLGNCNACDRDMTYVVEIKMETIGLRLCPFCANELVEKLTEMGFPMYPYHLSGE